MMLEELQRRNYSQSAVRAYVRVVRELAAYFRQSPDKLGPDHLRQFQAHLKRKKHSLILRIVVQVVFSCSVGRSFGQMHVAAAPNIILKTHISSIVALAPDLAALPNLRTLGRLSRLSCTPEMSRLRRNPLQ
jgi:hypothetical protein